MRQMLVYLEDIGEYGLFFLSCVLYGNDIACAHWHENSFAVIIIKENGFKQLM